MSNLNYFIVNIFKHDVVNKFPVKNIKNTSVLQKICLSFKFKKYELNKILVSLVALELITCQKVSVSPSKKPKFILHLKDGTPVGCRITLRKFSAIRFLKYWVVNLQPIIKKINKVKLTKCHFLKNTMTLRINSVINIPELEGNYFLFKQLSNLTITFVLKKQEFNTSGFFLKSIKLFCI